MSIVMPDSLIVQLDGNPGQYIAPGSAIICQAGADGLPFVRNGNVTVWYEGNTNGAVNLTHFIERARCAAGRMMHAYPTVAMMHVHPSELRVLADFDPVRGIVTGIMDFGNLSRQAGEDVSRLLPPETPPGGTDDGAEIGKAAALPAGRMLQVQPYVWQVSDGRIIIGPGDGEMRMYGPDDPVLMSAADTLDEVTQRIISGVSSRPAMKDMLSGSGGD